MLIYNLVFTRTGNHMDLINEYRNAAYNYHFECDYMWLNLEKDRANIVSYLETKQKRESTTNRFTISDIEDVFKDRNFSEVDEGFISKIVIQKANFDVKQSTKENGCTTRLLFIVRDSPGSGSWYVYGYAKGRYNNWSKFSIEEGKKLGYSFYISLSELDAHWSSGLSDNRAFERLLAKLRNRKSQC
jgi:hypothetical protein